MSNVQVQLGGNSVQVQVQSSGFARANAAVTLAAASATAAAASAASAAATLAGAALKANNLSDLASAPTALTNLGGTTVGKAIFTAANAAAARTAAGVVIGTDVQAFDPDLATWATITPGTGVGAALAVNVGSAGAFTTFNGAGGTPSSMTLTNATGLPVAGITSSTSTALGVGSLELGHATDTTLARSSAGNMTIEGNLVYRAGGTDVPVADGGTGSSTAADARTALAVVGTADLAASTGAALVGSIQSGTGAVARTVQEKLRTIVTPEDFGAVGDGVADDTAAMQAAMDAADEVVGKDSAIYSVTNIKHRSDKTFRGNCEIRQRTAGSPAWFFDATAARIERARLLGPHFRGHASSTVECVRMQESGGLAILGAEVDIQGTGGYHTLKIVCTAGNAVYGCRITVLQHSSLNTGCVLSGVYNVYDMFISDAANGLAYDDTGANSHFIRAISNCGQQSSAQNSVWDDVTVEGWVGTGKDNALQFTGANPSINNCCIINVPSATTPGGIGFNVGGGTWFAVRGLRIYGTSFPLYPIDLRNNAGGLIENAFMVGGFKLEQYHTVAEMRSLTFAGYCSTMSAYGARMIGTAVYDPASLVDGAGVTTTVTVTGAVLGDFAKATFSLDLQGITLTAWVSAADTVSVRFQNETGGTIDLASGTILARAEKT